MLERVLALPAAEFHLDLVRAPGQLAPALAALSASSARLSLGLIDGRNVWIADLDRALEAVDAAAGELGAERITIAPSCSLLHVPYEAAAETGIDPEVRTWLSFCAEKLGELRLLGEAATEPPDRRDELLASNREAVSGRRNSAHTNDPAVRERVGSLGRGDYERAERYPRRREVQRERLSLPELPTTTIGSYPQTDEIRATRRRFRRGRDRPRRVRGVHRGPDPPRGGGAGGARPGRARARRARAKRHGRIFRRAARRLRVFGQRLGAVLAAVAA